MKYKKGLLIICLIICLFTIASVAANEMNETVVASENQSGEVLSIENQCASDDNDIQYNGNNDDLLQSSNSEVFSLNDTKTPVIATSQKDILGDEKIPVVINVDDAVFDLPANNFTIPINVTKDDSGVSGVSIITNIIDNQYGEIVDGIEHDTNVTSSHVTDSNGQVKLDINYLASGTYILTVSLNDDSYEATNVSAIVLIRKQATKVSTVFGEDAGGKYLGISLKDSQDNPIKMAKITIELNEKTFSLKTNSTGQCKAYYSNNGISDGDESVVVLKNIPSGSYAASIKFIGNKVYKACSKKVKVEISNVGNKNPDETITNKYDGTTVIKLHNDAQGTITVLVNGVKYKVVQIVKGIAKIDLSKFKGGNYLVTFKYSGDSKYAPFKKTIKMGATKKKAKTKLTLAKFKIKKSAKKLVLKATLKKGKKALKGKKVTFRFDGKKYSARTNKKGVAKVTVKKKVLKKLKVGKKVKIKASYGKTTVKKTIKVKK